MNKYGNALGRATSRFMSQYTLCNLCNLQYEVVGTIKALVNHKSLDLLRKIENATSTQTIEIIVQENVLQMIIPQKTCIIFNNKMYIITMSAEDFNQDGFYKFYGSSNLNTN